MGCSSLTAWVCRAYSPVWGGQFGGMQQGGIGGLQGLTPNIPFGFQHSPFQQFTSPFVNPFLSSPWSQIGTPWGQTGTPWNLLAQTGGIGGGIGGFGGGIGGFGGGLSQLYGGGLGHSPFQSPDLIERQLAEVR